jgi:hypothetical protein
MDAFINSLPPLGDMLVRIVAALLVLLVGWLIAWIIANLVRKLLERIGLDNRAAGMAGDEKVPAVEEGIAKIVFYVLMLIVLVAFFQVLGLTIITTPLNALLASLLAFLPSLLAAAALTVAAWIVATILRGLTRKVLETANIDQRVNQQGGPESPSLSKALSEAVYWLVWLIFLPAILGALGLTSLVTPLVNMFNTVLAYLPRLFAAAVILIVGWFVAKIVQRIATSFLAAVGVDRFSERIGLTRLLGRQTLSSLLGLVVFILILLPVVIAALQALQLTALTAPLTSMLATALNAIPKVLAAFVILAVATIIGRLVGDLVAGLLEGLGFDRIFVRLGLVKETPVRVYPDAASARTTPSRIVGIVVMVGIILLAALSASSLLGFPALSLVITQFIAFAWNILIGVAIFMIGLWLANLVGNAITTSNLSHKRPVALFARGAVVVLATAMALGQMGLADSIVNLAFGLTLGAVAVATALAFGLGGRAIAARELEGWVNTLQQGDVPGIASPDEDTHLT